MYNRILVSTDGSEFGQKGVDHGLALAEALGVEVTVITVTEPFPAYFGGVMGYDLSWNDAALVEYAGGQKKAADGILTRAKYSGGQTDAANRILTRAKQAADRLGVSVELVHVPDSQVANAIIATAHEQNCGLIVMASHGRRGLGRLLLGSKTSEVLTHSNIPVLVVR